MTFLEKHYPTLYVGGKVSAVTLESTVEEVREWIVSHVKRGRKTKCPCCGTGLQIYHRNIYRSMALFLQWLANNPGPHFSQEIHAGAMKTYPDEGIGKMGQIELSKLSYWRLTEWKKLQTHTQHWITDKGRDFVDGKITIPKYAVVLQGKLRGLTGDEIDFEYCLSRAANVGKPATPWNPR